MSATDYLRWPRRRPSVVTDLYVADKQAPYPAIREFILDKHDRTCQICGGAADEVDHKWPRELGGMEHAHNLQAVCGPCNKRKGTKVDLSTASGREAELGLAALYKRATRSVYTLRAFAVDAINSRRDPLEQEITAATAAAFLDALAAEATVAATILRQSISDELGIDYDSHNCLGLAS